MALTERLKFVLEFNGSDAVKGFQQIGNTADKELGKAESKLDKVAGNMTKFGAGAVAFAGVAGAALFKTASEFSNLGIEAGKFSETTGLAVDDASRWIEVAGDMGVESATLEASLNKMNIAADKAPEKFAKFGVEIARTKDGAVDVNQTFLNTIDRLNGIKDPAEKARVASELLGKGWTGMSELIATGSDTLSASLASVSDAKVISPEELEKAKQLRAGMDTLKDSAENLVLTIGGALAPAFATVAETIGGAVEKFNSLNDASGGMVGKIAGIGTAVLGAAGALSFIGGKAIGARDSLQKMFTTVDTDGVRSMSKFGGVAAVGMGLATLAVIGYQLGQEKAAARQKELLEGMQELSRVAEGDLAATLDGILSNAILANVGAGTALADTYDLLAQSNLAGAQRALEFALATGRSKTEIDLLTDAIAKEEAAQAQAILTTAAAEAAADGLKVAIHGAGEAAREGATNSRALKDVTAELATASDQSAAAIDRQTAAFKALTVAITDDQSLIDLDTQFANLETSSLDAFYAAASGAEDAAQKQRDYETELNTTKQKIIEIGEQIGLTPTEVETLLTMVDNGSIAEVNKQIDFAARARDVQLRLIASGGQVDTILINGPARAAGGPTEAGVVHPVGETRPEMFTDARGQRYLIPGPGGGNVVANPSVGGSVNKTINNVFNVYERIDLDAAIAKVNFQMLGV